MATTSPESLERGQLGLFGVIMPGLAQIAPAFNLFFTTGVIWARPGMITPNSPSWPRSSDSGDVVAMASPSRAV